MCGVSGKVVGSQVVCSSVEEGVARKREGVWVLSLTGGEEMFLCSGNSSGSAKQQR